MYIMSSLVIDTVVMVLIVIILILLDIAIKQYLEHAQIMPELILDWDEKGIVITNSAHVIPDEVANEVKEYGLDTVIVETTVTMDEAEHHVINNAKLINELVKSGLQIYVGLIKDYFDDDKVHYSTQLLGQQLMMIASMKSALGKSMKGIYLPVHESSLNDRDVVNSINTIKQYIQKYGGKCVLALRGNLNISREDMIKYMKRAIKLEPDMILVRVDLNGAKMPLMKIVERVRLLNILSKKHHIPIGMVLLADAAVTEPHRTKLIETIIDNIKRYVHILFVGDYSQINNTVLEKLRDI